jgi:hypothetical protein
MAGLFWDVLPYLLSWFLNFLIIAIVVAVFDEQRHFGIEYHQYLGGFLLFVLPTMGEFLSWWFIGKPMIYFG